MSRIIKNPIHLTIQEIEEFANVLRTNNYQIVTSLPSIDNVPESLISHYKNQETHQRILDDQNAAFNFFSIKYTTYLHEDIVVPIGVYGISDYWKVRFPLVVNGFWQGFFMGNKDSFRAIANIDENNCEVYYSKMISLKKELMYKIFEYYYSLDSNYCSAMAWEIRNEKSNTRTIAESLTFQRLENNGTEIYSSSNIAPNKWNYLVDCRLRWGIIIDDSQQNVSNERYPLDKLQIFIRSIVDYG